MSVSTKFSETVNEANTKMSSSCSSSTYQLAEVGNQKGYPHFILDNSLQFLCCHTNLYTQIQ